jgi:hypothetical protein
LVGGGISGKRDGPVSEIKFHDGQKPPTEKAIQAKLAELQADYDSKKYQRDRKYPELGEQLDLLFHDMTAGKGDKTGEWYKAVNKVKTDHPKPE